MEKQNNTIKFGVPGFFAVPGCSGVFRGVPGCSGVFRGFPGVPVFLVLVMMPFLFGFVACCAFPEKYNDWRTQSINFVFGCNLFPIW